MENMYRGTVASAPCRCGIRTPWQTESLQPGTSDVRHTRLRVTEPSGGAPSRHGGFVPFAGVPALDVLVPTPRPAGSPVPSRPV